MLLNVAIKCEVMNMDRTTLKSSIVIAIIGIIISLIYFRPVSIERNYSGYMYAENSEFGKLTEIKLNGELEKKLSLNYVFTGSIEVAGTLNTSKDFNEVIIRLGKIDSKYNGKFNICGPSSNIENVKSITTRIEKND